MGKNLVTSEIFINARFLTQSITGVQRYAHELVKALDDLIGQGEIDKAKYRFTLLSPGKGIKHDLGLKHIPLRQVGYLTGHAWEQMELPFYTAGGLLISLCNTAPLLKNSQIVTIHDAGVFGFPQSYSLAFRTWYKLLFAVLGKNAKRIITVSSFSKRELIGYCKINEEKIHVIYLGKEHFLNLEPDNSILTKYNLTNKHYVFAVSSMSLHKNFGALVRAVEYLGTDTDFIVVIAGGANPKVFSSGVRLPGNVCYVGYLNDNQLRALYENAACFVFPSLYEGFGLPPLEAMACRCPVIVSDTASLPEVCGDAALYCDPENPDDIAGKIRQVITDESLRQTLREKGLARAEQFTWEECARKTLAVIEKVLTDRKQ